MLIRRDSPGFTLIELMIAIALLSILMLLGVPAFSTYINNSKIRASTESFFAGVQMTRGEAVRRNAQVQILLTDDPTVAAGGNVANTVTLVSNTGSGWLVRNWNATSGQFDFIEAKSGAEGAAGPGGASAVQVTGTLADASPVDTVTFNGFGATTLNQTATFTFRNATGGACAPAGPMRCLSVTVSIGGQARMCDPAVATVGDTRKC